MVFMHFPNVRYPFTFAVGMTVGLTLFAWLVSLFNRLQLREQVSSTAYPHSIPTIVTVIDPILDMSQIEWRLR